MIGPLLLEIGEELLGRRIRVGDPPVKVGLHDRLRIERGEGGHPRQFLLHAQHFQGLGAQHGQPLGQAELLGGPLLRLAAVDRHRAEGLAGPLHGGAERGLEGLQAGNAQHQEVGAERCVIERGGSILLDD